jgi:hypothetical protein
MLGSTVILALAGLGAATSFNNRNHLKGSQANLLLPGANSIALATSSNCGSLEKECDGCCIPSGDVCCGDGDGAYCDSGYYCQTDGCCENGELCTGPPTGCSDGKELCGDYCVPEGSVCCGDSGSYCDSGETCTDDGFCEVGDSSDSDDESGSSGCTSDQDECDGYCIPSGSVCCGDGYYCDAGETCGSGLTCDSGSSSDDTTDSSSSETSSTPSATETDSDIPIPTLDLGGDDDDDSSTSDSADDEPNLCARRRGGGDGDSDSSDDGGDDCGAAGIVGVPTLLVAVVAAFALL